MGAYVKVEGGYLHDGIGHRRDHNGNWPIYPLPRWSSFEKCYRNKHGTAADIVHYMQFFINNYQTLYNCDITGNEIADILCNMYNTSIDDELVEVNKVFRSHFPNWTVIFDALKAVHEKEMRNTVILMG